MEFVKGRIITDPDLKTLPKEERRAAWFSLVETLAWLHSIDPDSIGLQGFGKKTGFYARHCNTFSRIEADQAKVKDIKTGKPLGRAHPQFDNIVNFIRQNLPGDRASIVHGDYKFDNVILHPTEPRVIAILDWELSTVGHPLMDAVYVVGPFWNRASSTGKSGPPVAARDDQGGVAYDPENLEASGFPTEKELLDRYAKITGWDPTQDKWEVAKVFHLMRVSFQTGFLSDFLLTNVRAVSSAMAFKRERSVVRLAQNSLTSTSRTPTEASKRRYERCAKFRRRSPQRAICRYSMYSQCKMILNASAAQ